MDSECFTAYNCPYNHNRHIICYDLMRRKEKQLFYSTVLEHVRLSETVFQVLSNEHISQITF